MKGMRNESGEGMARSSTEKEEPRNYCDVN